MLQTNDVCPHGFANVPNITDTGSYGIKYLGALDVIEPEIFPLDNKVHLVHFGAGDGSTDAARDLLIGQGWEIVEHTYSLDTVPVKSTVLVLDEMFIPVIPHLGDAQFAALREIMSRECRLLWVTLGYVFGFPGTAIFRPSH